MALPYDLHVQFEKTSADGALAGIVTVAVCEDCTCRKLLLWAGKSTSEEGDFQPQGLARTLADWVGWRAGETYCYPFSVSTDSTIANAEAWGVRTQIHRIGEWEPDSEQLFLAMPVAQLVPAQPGTVEAQSLPEFTPAQRGRHSRIAEASSLVQDLALEFDRKDAVFNFGDAISGFVTFAPVRDLVDYRLGLDYQWRTHGQTERRSGEHHPVSISAQSTWQAGQEYRLPFRFSIPDGPRTSHGHSEKLDWYVWPVLIPLDGSETLTLLQVERAIKLLPIPETASHLEVRSLSAARIDHLVLAGFILLVALLLGAALVANLFGWGPPLHGWSRVFVALVALVILAVGLGELFERGIAEYYIGRPDVNVAGDGEVRATVSLQPKRDVQLETLKLALKVDEETTVWEGTTSKTTSRTLFSQTEKLSLDQAVAAGQEWSGSIGVPFPAYLPATGRRRVGKGTKLAIVWRAELSIIQLGHTGWCKSYKLTVREAVTKNGHFWMVKS